MSVLSDFRRVARSPRWWAASPILALALALIVVSGVAKAVSEGIDIVVSGVAKAVSEGIDSAARWMLRLHSRLAFHFGRTTRTPEGK